MDFIIGNNRHQGMLLPDCIEDYVDENNPVRVIDAYVDTLDFENLGFNKWKPNQTGRPMYSPRDLLKLYIYGYMNHVRSSRRLEIETKRNLEVIWLLQKLSPDHKTIARFRQQNPTALKNVFKNFVQLCTQWELYGKELLAIDGSKFKAWNTKDRNFTKNKLKDRIQHIEEKIESYLDALNQNDALENQSTSEISSDISEVIHQLTDRKTLYESFLAELAESDETQISLTDPDSRLMKTKNGLDVCLNIQTAVDSKNKMIVEFTVENQAQDKNLMGPLAQKAADLLEVPAMTVVADNGYDSVSDVAQLYLSGHRPVVAGRDYEFCIPTDAANTEKITDYDSNVARAIYLPERNIFICPLGKVLRPCTYNKNKHVAKYDNTQACRHCPKKCTKMRYYRAERVMKPSEYTKAFDDSDLFLRKVHIFQNKEIVRQRKAIVEHPFGTVKRAMGISYLLLKGKQKVEGEIALAFLAFNLKRAIHIMGIQPLIQAIRA